MDSGAIVDSATPQERAPTAPTTTDVSSTIPSMQALCDKLSQDLLAARAEVQELRVANARLSTETTATAADRLRWETEARNSWCAVEQVTRELQSTHVALEKSRGELAQFKAEVNFRFEEVWRDLARINQHQQQQHQEHSQIATGAATCYPVAPAAAGEPYPHTWGSRGATYGH